MRRSPDIRPSTADFKPEVLLEEGLRRFLDGRPGFTQGSNRYRLAQLINKQILQTMAGMLGRMDAPFDELEW